VLRGIERFDITTLILRRVRQRWQLTDQPHRSERTGGFRIAGNKK
jgi:hypothetical protein